MKNLIYYFSQTHFKQSWKMMVHLNNLKNYGIPLDIIVAFDLILGDAYDQLKRKGIRQGLEKKEMKLMLMQLAKERKLFKPDPFEGMKNLIYYFSQTHFKQSWKMMVHLNNLKNYGIPLDIIFKPDRFEGMKNLIYYFSQTHFKQSWKMMVHLNNLKNYGIPLDNILAFDLILGNAYDQLKRKGIRQGLEKKEMKLMLMQLVKERKLV
ncbi:hypothetical protein L1987_80409 [Smallanthus sonchifolius]|uniref:Uncharacterized protein n=1 Tax=Smallanthus sonchifolius TaxID=185202 RepID=A0ACB8YRU4_9ASTR|nr:hypothetical protein L1987_80409 [Smallanthus sonchifolius]